MSAGEARALLGAWSQIVGAAEAAPPGGLAPMAPQRSGYPSNHQHGADGGYYHQGHRGNGGWSQELGIPPRNLLIEQPAPQFARREALPLNSGDVAVHTNGTLQITSRPQRPAYRPERFFVSPPVGGDPLGETASSWIINDITIGNKSQYAQAGQLPGDMFSSTAIDSFVSFDTVQTAMDVVVVTTYIGTSSAAVKFVGGMLGTSAVHG